MKYLREAEQDEAMAVFYSTDEPAPLTHTVWTGDFMALAKHNVPCPVCFNGHAFLERNVTPGQWSQQFGPCGACETQGWEIRRRPWWLRLISRGRP
jgi:hypothetical protein